MSENSEKTASEMMLVYPGDMLEVLAAATARAEVAEAHAAKLQRDYDSAVVGEAKRQLEAERGSLLTVIPTGTLEEIKTQARKKGEARAEAAEQDAERLAVALAYCIKALEKLDDFKPYPGCANPFAEVLTMGRAALAAHDAAKERGE